MTTVEQIPIWSTTYERGMSAVEGTREAYGILAVKRELVYNGYEGRLGTNSYVCGGGFDRAVRWFQTLHGEVLSVDGVVGPATGKELFRKRVFTCEQAKRIPNHWAWRLIGHESDYDPIAIYFNGNGTTDRGLIQANSATDLSLTESEAYDPAVSIPYLCQKLKGVSAAFVNCRVNKWRLAVASHRTPVGAEYWCDHPDTADVDHQGDCPAPSDPGYDQCWGEQAVHYVNKVAAVPL